MARPFRVLAAVDFSTASLEAMMYGATLARLTGGDMILLSVANWPGRSVGDDGDFPSFYDADEGLRLLLERRLQKLAGEIPYLVTQPAQIQVRFGTPENEIVRTARNEQADMIVLGTRGRKGFLRALAGSVAEGVLRQAPCAVMVIREGVHPLPDRLLVAEGVSVR
jgi:universal stress protein A